MDFFPEFLEFTKALYNIFSDVLSIVPYQNLYSENPPRVLFKVHPYVLSGIPYDNLSGVYVF